MAIAIALIVLIVIQAYDQAMQELKQNPDKRPIQFREEFRERQLCLYVDDEELEDLMAPFVQVGERVDGKAKVTYTVEYYKKFEYLHRRITRVTYTGWTDEANLKLY